MEGSYLRHISASRRGLFHTLPAVSYTPKPEQNSQYAQLMPLSVACRATNSVHLARECRSALL